MAPTVPESIRSFLDEEVKEHQFLGFFGLTKSTTTIAKGEYLRIDLQCVSTVLFLVAALHSLSIPKPIGTKLIVASQMTTERPGEPRAYNLQMQVNNEAKGALAKLDRTSETSTLRRSRPTLATILVDAEVDPEKISESSMKSFWIEVTEPWTKKSKNKGRVDKE